MTQAAPLYVRFGAAGGGIRLRQAEAIKIDPLTGRIRVRFLDDSARRWIDPSSIVPADQLDAARTESDLWAAFDLDPERASP